MKSALVADSKRVGIWIRVSTEDQVRGESPEHHEKRARLYAEAKGWNVVEIYRLDAVSGKTVKETPEAKRMMEDVREGHISGIIFSKLARLARNTKELLEFAEYFREHNADLISLAEAIDTSTPAGRLFYTMIAAMAQWEREEISERVAASVPIRAKLGKPTGGAAPFGYWWKDKQLVVDPKEAPVRKLIFELFREHRRKKLVARLLNEQGHRTRSGERFSDTTVDRLLRDPTAKGLRRANYTRSRGDGKHWDVKPENEWVFHDVPAIVSEDLWEECAGILETQRAAQKPRAKPTLHLFSGFAYCGCGAKMYVSSDSPKYLCKKCRIKIPRDDLEAIFHEQIKNFLFSTDEIAAHLEKANATIKEKSELLSVLEKERRKIAGEIDKLHDLYQSGEIDKKGFGARYRPMAERLEQLEERLPAAQAELDVLRIGQLSEEEVLRDARDLYTRWPELPFDEKRRIVETITERITIGEDEVEINLLYTPPPSSDSGGGSASGSGGNTASSCSNISGNRRNFATNTQGFIAATSRKRAGYVAWRAARAMEMLPDSSGSRNASSASRGNSGNSSRNNTP
ncbi:MAG: recombinase family protein [Betaproteobacteria bacterium]|nr:recombinase family protein [Betaproteobacteria bacterium]